jgi:hypothetical protein
VGLLTVTDGMNMPESALCLMQSLCARFRFGARIASCVPLAGITTL